MITQPNTVTLSRMTSSVPVCFAPVRKESTVFRMPDSWYDPPELDEHECTGDYCVCQYTKEDYLEDKAERERDDRH